MKENQRALLQFGTFDVRNYGDLLFPRIAEWRLRDSGWTVVPVSPTDHDVGWADCVRPIPVETALRRTDIAAVLIGGGNIAHSRRVRLPDYRDAGVADWAYMSLWYGASLLAAIRHTPIAWNAPGVPLPLADGPEGPLAAYALRAAEYRSVRDEESRANLPDAEAAIVPDTAVEISRMWPRRGLAAAWRDLLEKEARPVDARFAAIHVKARAIADGDHAALAALIDSFAAETGLIPVLIAIGPCHGDDVVARRLSMLMRCDHITLANPDGLRQIAAAIAWADVYIGCSLHGYITAFSYGTPGVLVARPAQAKLDGFLRHVDRQQDLAGEWDAAFAAALAHVTGTRAKRGQLRKAIVAELDVHWGMIADVVTGPATTQGRGRLLTKHVRDAITRGGVGWLLAPQLAPT